MGGRGAGTTWNGPILAVSSVDDVGLLQEELTPFTTELNTPVAEEWETLKTAAACRSAPA